jgi:hypothetical protein
MRLIPLAFLAVLLSLRPERQCRAAVTVPPADDRAVPYYTGTVYPTPQQAHYGETFVALSHVHIKLDPTLAKEDPRVGLLVDRLRRAGATLDFVSDASKAEGTLILLGETDAHNTLLGDRSTPENPEGYLLHCAQNGRQSVVFIKGRDFHGLLWAITSFNQLITEHNGEPVARVASLQDYPEFPGIRAFTPFRDDDEASNAWFGATVLRSNAVIYRQLRNRSDWRLPLRDEGRFNAWKARIQKIGAQLNPLKIAWYDSVMPMSGVRVEDQVRSKSQEDLDLVIKAAMALAEAGGRLCLLYDDYRFFIHPEDVRDFGSAREADVYFLNAVYSAVSAKHPDFRMLFCPPFYWGAPGPDDTTTYGESRDAYLRAIGERLPQAIEVYWSGPRVKSTRVSEEELQWFSGITRRKPVFWQNACGTYHGSPYYAYPGEPLNAWREWYDAAFLRGLSMYTYNGEDPYINLTITDALWNHRAYDPVASGEMAAKKLVGSENYPRIIEANKVLESLDDYGWFQPSALAARNVDHVRQQTEALSSMYESAPAALKSRWLMLGTYVSYRQKYFDALLKNPHLKESTEADERVRELALTETATDPKASVVLTPGQLSAGRPAQFYSWKDVPRRHVLWINGARSKAPSLEASFQLGYRLQGDSELIISGLDDNAPTACRIRVQINGHTLFEGPNPFASDRWSNHRFAVPGAILRDGVPNVLRIENLEPSDNMIGAPWFMVSYAVLRPGQAKN